MKCRSLTKWLGAAALLSVAGTVAAQDRAAWVDPNAGLVPDEVVQNGYRRVHRTDVQQLTPEELAALIADGKDFEIDAATGGIIRQTFTDYLPQGWLMEPPADGSKVDSYGNPIVNEAQGLPAWSQRNIDALRTELANARDTLLAQRASGVDTREAEGVLGNYLGQAIARDINVDAIVNLNNGSVVDAGVAAHVISYLHYYENERFSKQEIFHYTYTPTQYSPRVTAFLASHGATLEQVQQIEQSAFGDRGTGCYNTTTFARGMSILAAPTAIWNADNSDDVFSDVPLGFGNASFYDCDDPDGNNNVRVSSNGFISFFEQGGNSTDGGNRFNNTLPDAAEVNGFAGPFWDDLIVSNLSGDQVRYLTEGAVGDRVFTMENYSVSHFGSASTSEFYYFQVKVYEMSNVVEFHFNTLWNNGGEESATIGMENFSGTEAHCGPNCGPLNIDAPASNYSYAYFRPFNDTCVNAGVVFGGSIINGDLTRASNDGDVSCTGSGAIARDVWYTFLAPCDGDLVVNTCGSYGGGGVDTVVSAHSACPGNGANQLACNDQFGGAGCSVNDSQITVSMTVNQRVYIRVSHWANNSSSVQDGTFTGTVTFNQTGTAPANDNCANAFQVGEGTTFGDIGCASADAASSGCGASTANRDVWYRYTATCPGTLTVDTCGTQVAGGMDTVVTLHSTCGGPVVNCNDQHFGGAGCAVNDSLVTYSMSANESVLIRVTHWTSEFNLGDGTFNLRLAYASNAPVPANDTCATAIPVSCNETVIGYNCNATNDLPDTANSCGTGAVNAGVWYTVVGNGAEFGVTTCNAVTNFDTKVSVYTGSCGALTCVAGNDDIVCGAAPGASRVTWSSVPGTRYYIFVQGFADVRGVFALTIVNNGLPSNDNCSSAQNVASGTYLGNLWCATNDGTASCGGSATNRDVWYRFVAPADGTLTVDGCGSRNGGGIDMVLAAFAGSCAGPEVLCNDDFGGPGCSILDSVISGPMAAGQVVFLRVSHFGGGDPSFRMGNGGYVLNINFSGCDSIDWNGDGLFPDTQDIADFISVFGGGFCAAPNPPLCNTDIDFNNDGLFPDTDDIAAFIRVFSGGSCF